MKSATRRLTILAAAGVCLAAPALAGGAVVIVPSIPRGSEPVADEAARIAGYIGKMVRLVRAPSATASRAASVRTTRIEVALDTGVSASQIGVAIKMARPGAALVIQGGNWVSIGRDQYASLAEYLVVEARVAWICGAPGQAPLGAGTPDPAPRVRNLDPVVFGAPKGNLLPNGGEVFRLRLAIPPAVAPIAGPPGDCPHPEARIRLTLTADLPDSYPTGVPIGVGGLPASGSASLNF